jgi:hypothetical protein
MPRFEKATSPQPKDSSLGKKSCQISQPVRPCPLRTSTSSIDVSGAIAFFVEESDVYVMVAKALCWGTTPFSLTMN